MNGTNRPKKLLVHFYDTIIFQLGKHEFHKSELTPWQKRLHYTPTQGQVYDSFHAHGRKRYPFSTSEEERRGGEEVSLLAAVVCSS